jgi:transcriptional regulator with XRE-family HTH domain
VVYLNDDNFGLYFKNIRKSKNITQEQVANYINRKKMTISLIENGKNEPPSGDLLKNMIDSLSLEDETEKNNLYLLASKSRGSLPFDIEEYFYSNKEIYNAIKRGMKKNKKNIDWENIFK